MTTRLSPLSPVVRLLVFFSVALLPDAYTAVANAADVYTADFRTIDANGLPPRTLIAAPPARPVPRWLQTNLRIGHLPGYDDRMVKEFLKAGYNVVTVNCLERWDRVGPSAVMYPADEVEAGRRVSASRCRHDPRRWGQECAVYRTGAGSPLQQAVSRGASRVAPREAGRLAG